MPTSETEAGVDVVSKQPSKEAELRYRISVDDSGTKATLASITAIRPRDAVDGGRLVFSTDAIGGEVTGRLVIDHQGNVGIGTENPRARLEVAGDVMLNGPLNVQGALGVNGATEIRGDLAVTGKLSAVSFAGDGAGLNNITLADASVTNTQLAPDAASFTKVSGGLMTVASGNIGIGTEKPASKLHILSSADDALPPRLQSSANPSFAAGWDFYHEEAPKGYVGVPGSGTGIAPGEMLLFGAAATKTSLWAGGNRSVTLDTNGKVGIGTTSPDRPLTIQAVNASQELISFKDPNGITKWHINQNLGGTLAGLNFVESGVADGRLFLRVGGNVGIATVNPQRKLQIGDDVIGLGFDPGTSPNAGVLRFGDNTGWKLHFGRSRERSGGGLNSGTTGLLMTIQDNGDLIVQGSARARNFPAPSDAKFKTNITPLTNVLDKLEKIRGIAFSWRGLYESQGRPDDRKEIGLIAQEVEAVFPELVTTWADEDSKAVEYGRFSAVLLEAVKELKANVDALTTKIALLQS